MYAIVEPVGSDGKPRNLKTIFVWRTSASLALKTAAREDAPL